MWTFFILSSIGIHISIVLLIRKYADKGVEWIVRIATGYAWLTSMCIVALVPFDVFTTLAGMTQGRTFVGALWSVAYWSTQLATWLVLPFYQVYSEAGDFSVKERAWTSIKENALLYGVVGGVGIIGIAALFILRVVDFQGMMGLGVGLSNAFGLVAGLLLMGYGLVEIPRQTWKGANPETSLKWAAHRSGTFAEAVMKARVELKDVITIIYANQRQMRRHDPLQKYMEIVFEYAERESPIKPSEMANRSVDIDHLKAEDLEYNYDKPGLAKLRRRLFWAISDYRGAHARYAGVVMEALEWEGIVKARSTQVFIQPGPPPGRKSRPWDGPMWVYNTRVRPYANKVFAGFLVVASLGIIWGEVTIPVHEPDMSPYSLLIKSVDKGDEFFVQLFTLLPLVYICASMYYTLFRINAFNYNKLVVGATTGAALMQNGSLMCRFAAPTCWNFYHIIHMTKDFCPPKSKTCLTTVFDEKMASLSTLPSFLNLNKYLPVILGVHCVLTALNLWDRLLNCCKSARYRFSDDDVEDDYTEKGRLLIRKEADAMAMGYKVGDILATAYVDLQFPHVKGMERATGQQQSKSIFSSLFGRKPLEPVAGAPEQVVVVRSDAANAITPGASSSSVLTTGPQPTAITTTSNVGGDGGVATPKSYTSAAAQAASRWLTGARGVTSSTTGASSSTAPPHVNSTSSLLQLNTENPKISLLGARMDNSNSPEYLASSSASSDKAGAGGTGGGGGGLDGIFAGLMGGAPAPRPSASGGNERVSLISGWKQ